MGLRNNALIVLLSFSLFFSPEISAQDEPQEQTLEAILLTLQTSYGVQFNYTAETIQGIQIKTPPENLSLTALLSYLRTETGLMFTKLNNNIISVKKPKGLVFCAYLKSLETQQAVVNALVSVENETAISDEEGFFQIEISNPQSAVTISHLAYKPITYQIENFQPSKCEEIWLEPKIESLSEVLISNYLVSGINKLNDGTFEIDFSNFDILPGLVETDVLHSIQAFPGILSDDETVSNISIRGGSHDQNLMLWDGIKMYQSGHFFGLISMFNPQITQNVSLIKNGTDASYTDGTSGTIAMKTKRDLNTDFNGSLGANFIDVNGFADVPLGKKSSLQVSARKALSDLFSTPTYSEYFDRIAQNTEVEENAEMVSNSDKTFDFYDVSLRWLYKISPKDELRLNFINVSNQLIFDENSILDNTEVSRQSELSQNSIAGGLFYNRTWSDKWQTSLKIYETDYTLRAINANILDSQRFLQENSVSESSLQLNSRYRLSDRLLLKNGYQFTETQVTNLDDVDSPRFRVLVAEVLRLHALYSQLDFVSLNRKTSVNAGLRYTLISEFNKNLIEPRISFNQKFLDHFTLELLGEFKHQTTSQIINFQNDFLGIEKRRWQLANDDEIPIIQSKQASVGLTFSNGGWLASAEGYVKNLMGVTTQSQGFQNQYEFVKTDGDNTIYGFDLLLRKRLGNFKTWVSYAFMDNTYEFDDLSEVSFASNYSIPHSLTFGLSYIKNNLKLAAGLNWRSGKPITTPVIGNATDGETINYNPANSSRLDDYMRMDVSALYNWDFSDSTYLKFGVSIWNVLNNTNIINSNYRIVDGAVLRFDQESLGIMPNVLVRFYF